MTEGLQRVMAQDTPSTNEEEKEVDFQRELQMIQNEVEANDMSENIEQLQIDTIMEAQDQED